MRPGDRLQALAGNVSVMHSLGVCPKLSIGQPDIVQKKERSGQSSEIAPRTVSQIETLRSGGGEPLTESLRAFFEPRFGHDFSQVRLHHDGRAADSARELDARAYTAGGNIVFGAGEYRPEEPEGKKLLAHELTHVVQQSGSPRYGAQLKAADPTPSSLGSAGEAAERDAEATAERITSGGSAVTTGFHAAGPSVVQRQRDPNEEEDHLPEPLNVTWGSDRFRIGFRREEGSAGDARLNVEVRYLGPHPTSGPFVEDGVKLMHVDVGPRKLRAGLRQGASGEIVLDLYGDRGYTLRLQDSVEHDPRSFSFGREHRLHLIMNGESREFGSLWVLDPASTPTDTRSFRPGFLPGTVPEFDGAVNPATGKLELKALIDGDGDQYPELEVTIEADSFWSWGGQMRREEPIRVFLRQANDPSGTRRYFSFQVSALTGAPVASPADLGPSQSAAPPHAAKLAANVRLLTDGRAPTAIDLTDPASSEQLLIHPPTPIPNGVAYVVEKGSSRVRYEFPPEPAPLRPAVTAERGRVLGYVAFWDITLGPYNDRFRLLIDKGTSGQALAGLSPLGYEIGYMRGAAVPITLTGQPTSIQLMQSGPNSLALDFDGDDRADLTLHDRLQSQPGVSPERERTHEIRLSGPSVGAERTVTFVAGPGNWIRRPDEALRTTEDNRVIAAAGATQTLEVSERAGTFTQRRIEFEAAFHPYRRRALDSGWITQRTFDAWSHSETDMIRLEAQVSAGRVDASLGSSASTRVRALYDALATETVREVRTAATEVSSSDWNPFTGEGSHVGFLTGSVTLGPGAMAAEDFLAGRWGAGLARYAELRAGLDRWILERAERAGVSGREMAQMRASAAMIRELDRLSGKNPTRIHAVFRPDPKFRNEEGYIEQVPLELYYWREGSEWRLIDLTNPERPYRDSVTAGATDFESAGRLMGELDDEDHFCEGRIYYQVPGIASGQVKVIDRLRFQDFLKWLGVGLAIAGTVLSFGTGAVAVAGTWALVGSAVAGGTAAAINLYDTSRHGTATTTSILLDLTQIVTAVAGVGALAAGRVLSVARTSAAAGEPLAGARWATLAGMAQSYAVPLAATNLAGDVVTLAVLSVDAATQLDAVENGPGSPQAKRDAKLRLLMQFAFTGGLTALSLRGNVAEIQMGRSIEIINVRGEPVVVPVGMSTSGRAVSESAAQLSVAADDAARTLAEQTHLQTIRRRIEGPTGTTLANVEELALAAQTGRANAVLTADTAGSLTRGGAAAGSLDELTRSVADANNATRAHGIDVEYVLDIRSGGRGGVQEVRVARRVRTPGVGGDPRGLYAGVAGRTAAEAREIGRLRTAAGAAPFRIELSPDGLLRINGQLDVHPSRIAEMPDADVAALASATHALDAVRGNMAALRTDNPAAHSQLEKFGSSSDRPHASGHPSRGYRLRFAHSHQAGLDLIDDLLGQVGTNRASEVAFRDLTPQDLDRLYDLSSEPMPKGTTSVRTQATRYALDQAPANASEFVHHYQFYVAEVRLRIKAEADARTAAGQVIGPSATRRIGEETEATMADAANARVPSAATAAGVRAQYDRIRAEVGSGVGTSLIPPNLDDEAAVRAIRALPNVQFSGESAAVYHTYKHYREMPASRRPAGTSEFDAYSAAINAVIHNPAQSTADVVATRGAAQRGGGRSYTFTLREGDQTMTAIVFVSDGGVVSLSTMIPKQ